MLVNKIVKWVRNTLLKIDWWFVVQYDRRIALIFQCPR